MPIQSHTYLDQLLIFQPQCIKAPVLQQRHGYLDMSTIFVVFTQRYISQQQTNFFRYVSISCQTYEAG